MTLRNRFFAAFLLLAGLAACDGASEPPRVPTTLALDQATLTLSDGDSVRINAVVRDQKGDPLTRFPDGDTITWTSSDPSVVVVRGGLLVAQRPGTAVVTARLAGLSAQVTVTVQPVPTGLEAVSGDGLSAEPGRELRDSLVVRVVDRHGAGVPGVPVTFEVVSGGGSISPATTTSDAQGRARAQWTLGPTSGTQTARAIAAGDTVVFTATARQVATVRVTPAADTLAVGDTLRLQAVAMDGEGGIVEGTEFTWSTSDPQVATVDASGLVTARGAGTATITAQASSGTAGTATIRVEAPATPQCNPTSARSLRVGEVVTVSGAEAESLCVGGEADYVLIPFHATDAASTLQLEVLAQGVAPPPSTTLAASRTAAGATQLARARTPDPGFEARLRRREIRELTPLIANARLRLGREALPRQNVSAAPPAEGTLLQLNTSASCNNPTLRTGRVMAVTNRAIVVADTTNPAGGFTQEEYRSIGVTFDTLAYAIGVQNFGEPTDIDQNSRSIIFYTRAVNELTPPNNPSFVGGFFWAGDLFPKSQCQGSNFAEMFYMLVPDPNGEVNGNKREKEFVARQTLGTLGHELQHLINASRRIYVNGASSFEVVWLNEALSHIAEELMFYRASGTEPRRNLTLDDLRSSQTILTAVNRYQVSNFGRYRAFLVHPDSLTLAGSDNLATRGAGWAFLRYTADRETGSDQDLFFALANSKTAGLPNLRQVLNVEPLDWMQHWTVAVYADDHVPNVAPIFTQPSWHFRSILPALSSDGFPLRGIALSADQSVPLALRAGAVAYLRFAVASGGAGTVRIRSGSAAPPSTLRVSLLRTR